MLAILVLLSTTRADIAPSPTRPNWDDPDAPLPDPPSDLEVGLVVAAWVAAASLLVSRRRDPSPLTPSR